MMPNVFFNIPIPQNEPALTYGLGSPEKITLKKRIAELKADCIEIPLIINGKEVRTGNTGICVCPHEHRFVLAKYHKAGKKEIELAIDSALKARYEWGHMPCEVRASIFIKAADLLSGP